MRPARLLIAATLAATLAACTPSSSQSPTPSPSETPNASLSPTPSPTPTPLPTSIDSLPGLPDPGWSFRNGVDKRWEADFAEAFQGQPQADITSTVGVLNATAGTQPGHDGSGGVLVVWTKKVKKDEGDRDEWFLAGLRVDTGEALWHSDPLNLENCETLTGKDKAACLTLDGDLLTVDAAGNRATVTSGLGTASLFKQNEAVFVAFGSKSLYTSLLSLKPDGTEAWRVELEEPIRSNAPAWRGRGEDFDVAGDTFAIVDYADTGTVGEVRSVSTGELLATGPARVLSPKTIGPGPEVTLTEVGQQRLTVVPSLERDTFQYLRSRQGGIMIHQVENALQLCPDETPASCADLANTHGFGDALKLEASDTRFELTYVSGKPHLLARLKNHDKLYLFPIDGNQPAGPTSLPQDMIQGTQLPGDPNGILTPLDSSFSAPQTLVDVATGTTTTLEDTAGWYGDYGHGLDGWLFLWYGEKLRAYVAKS